MNSNQIREYIYLLQLGILAMVSAFWWGIVFPNLSLMEETYQIVWEDGQTMEDATLTEEDLQEEKFAGTEDGLQEEKFAGAEDGLQEEKSARAEESRKQEDFYRILRAEQGTVEIHSKLLDWIMRE